MNDPSPTWMFAELIAQLGGPEDPAARRALDELFFRNVRRVAGRYPEEWFDGFQKNPPAYQRLSRVLQSTSEIIGFPWFPFNERPPYGTWVAEHSPDRTVRWFTFSNKRYALLKLQLKKDYRENLLVYPALQGRSVLWKRVGGLLDVYAERVGESGTGSSVYALHPDRPTPAGPLDVAFEKALAERGTATRAALVDALRAHAPVVEPLPASASAADAATAVTVRRVVLEVWNQLSPDEQAIMAEVAAGRTALEMYQRRPYLANGTAVTRAVTAIDDHFLRALARELGAGPRDTASTDHTPRALCRLLYGVIEELVRAGGTWREAGRARAPGLPELPPPGPEEWERFERLWEALRDPWRAAREGLGGSLVAGIAQVAWEADPGRALADAEIDEGWVDDEGAGDP